MLKEWFKKSQEGKDKKKQIENIVVFIILLIITVLIINNMWSEESEEKNDIIDTSKVLAQTKTTNVNQDDLQERLEDILETINGVGKTKVLIKYSESSTIVAMYNETVSESSTKENNSDGGNKEIKESENKKEIVYTDENGTNQPITEKIIMPTIEGAVITAQGAGNANVKTSIVSAVEAVTGLAVHKIQVFEMKH